MAKAIVSIGSCKGHRRSVIERAVALVSDFASPQPVKCSSIIETPASGYESDAMFLNLCLSFETSLPPEPLLDALLEIQNSIDASPHRNSEGEYIDRVIDIDLIALGTRKFCSPKLQLPHPRSHLRDFVTIPFMEIEPELCFKICAILTDNTL